MVAIITGRGAGIENSSVALLGSAGAVGNAGLGRTQESVYVNAATGNLILTDVDEMLVGRGPDAVIARTYNSLGAWDGDNNDQWRAGVYRRVFGLTGTIGQPGSTIKRTDWDGSEQVFTWDTEASAYVTLDGAGARDTLKRVGTVWTWTDGSTQVSETFDDANSGRILSRSDASGNTVTYSYNANGQLTRVTSGSNEYTDLIYSGTLLTSLVTNAGGQTTRTSYLYDTSNRLWKVLVNLTPSDNLVSETDSDRYLTTYTYDGNSNRIATITQTDGTLVTFGYTLVGADYRVTSVSQTLTTGVTRTTTFSYNVAARTTTITDPAGQVTTLGYDVRGNLTSLTLPPATSGASVQTIAYAYDGNDNLLTTTMNGQVVASYGYDTRGNRTFERDATGNTIVWDYSAKNEVLAETRYTVPDPDGAGAGAPSGAETTNYVYDASSRLRYTITPTGQVTQYEYDGFGQVTATTRYAISRYTGTTFTEAALNSWRTGADKAQAQRTETAYDFRGNVQSITSYSRLLSTGAFDTASERTQTLYTYSSYGELLTRQSVGQASTTETYTYDGLSRIKTSVDLNGASTTYSYADAAGTTSVTLANNLVRTSTYNRLGELTSYAESGAGVTTATTSYAYDALGRLRFVTDPSLGRVHYLYDAVGRKIAEIDRDGSATEFRYDRENNLIGTTRFANRLTSAQLASLVSGSAPSNVVFATVRPTAHADDRKTWNVYDSANRLIRAIDATGAVTIFEYDGKSQLVRTTERAVRIDLAATADPSAAAAVPASDADDRVARNFYDANGKLVAKLDAGGFLVEFVYDEAGRKLRSIGYTEALAANRPLSGLTFAQLVQSGTVTQIKANIGSDTSKDARHWWLYDARGMLRAEIDAEGTLTRLNYSPAGYLTERIRDEKLDIASLIATAPTLANLPSLPAGFLSRTSWTHDAYGLVTSETKVLFGLITSTTTYTYDAMRRLVSSSEEIPQDPHVALNRRYDAQGRVIAELAEVGSGKLAALPSSATSADIEAIWDNWGWKFAYDASGRLTSKTGPKGEGAGAAAARTVYYYNTDGDLAWEINALGEVAEYRYNSFGERTDVIVYGKRLANLSGLNGGAIDSTLTSRLSGFADASIDSRVQTAFDANGSVKLTTNALGETVALTYNAFGELRTSTAQSEGSASIESIRTYDRRGLVKTEVVDSASGGKQITTSYGYDAFGRRITLTNALNKTTTTAYDRKGRVKSVTDALGAVTSYVYDARDNVVMVTDPLGKTTHYVFDKANRLAAEIDANGAVVATTYTPGDRVKMVTQYANGITDLASLANEVPYNFTRPDTSEDDKVSYQVFDRDGRIRFEINALRQVTEHVYDAKGNRTRSIAHAGSIAAPASPAAVTEAWVTTQVAGLNAANAQTTREVYDAANRLIYSIDSIGQVTWHVYGTKGELTKQVQIATLYAASDTPLIGAMETWRTGTAAANASNDRVTRAYYDRKGQLAYSIDALGYVTRIDYDKLGNVRKQIRYAAAYTASDSTTLANLTSAFGSVPGDARVTEFKYDSAGRLTETVDPMGYRTYLTLDAVGQVLTSTEAYTTSAASTTAFTYDNVGRVVKQVRASGSGYDATTWYYYDKLGQLVATVDPENYLTVSTFDAVGNQLSLTQHAGKITQAGVVSLTSTLAQLQAAAGSAADAIQSSATYDAFGRVKTSTDGRGSVVSTEYDALNRITSQNQQMGAGTEADDRVTSYAYDSFGNVAKVTDPRGNVSYSYYDKVNRVVRQVDAERYVTDTSYDRGGKVSEVKRYDNAIGSSVTISEWTRPAPPSGGLSSTKFTYDKRGDLVSTTDAMGFTEGYTLNAFGERTEYRNKLHGSNAGGPVLDTTVYYTYDKRGLLKTETLPILAEVLAGGGVMGAVVNTYDYDARGNLTKKVEAATSKTFRTTNYTYDQLDRVTTSYGDAVSVVNWDLTVSPDVVAVETINYDRRGNVISTIDKSGAKTMLWYDAFGRVVATAQQVDTSNGQRMGMLTRKDYDKSGNVIAERAYGYHVNMDAAALIASGQPPANTPYREVLYAYDASNRLSSTTIANVITGEWSGTAYTTSTADIVTRLEYNKAGNVTREIDARGNSVSHWYDKLGRESAKVDAEGYLTVWDRDAEGNVLSETRYADRIEFDRPTNPEAFNASTPRETLIAYASGDAVNNRVTTFTYDRMGRRKTESRAAVAHYYVLDKLTGTFNAATAASTISYLYNGLGQVTLKTYATGETAAYGYDAAGRLTWEYGSEFTDFAGNEEVVARTKFDYDGLNNLVTATALAREGAPATENRITKYVYAAGGALKSVEDAAGFIRTYGYDRSGRTVTESYQRLTALGAPITDQIRTRYDLAGRVVYRATGSMNGGAFNVLDYSQTEYTAIGEVWRSGSNGAYQTENNYDGAGRLVSTNGGDGIWKVIGYDRAGNQTVVIASAGASLAGDNLTSALAKVGQTNVNATYTVVDRRGLATRIVEEGRQRDAQTLAQGENLTTTKAYNAFGEVTEEVDANLGRYNYTYNTMGRLTKIERPTVKLANLTGAAQADIRPTEHRRYDAAGRLVGWVDANGNLTTQTLLEGTGYDGNEAIVNRVFSPDGGKVVTRYDVFGDARTITDQVQRVTQQSFDKMGRVTKIERSGGLIEEFAYDGLGQQIERWNNQLTRPSTTSGQTISVADKAVTAYDALGRVTLTRSFTGSSSEAVPNYDVTTYAYEWNGTLLTTGMGTFGGWKQITTFANGRTSVEETDIFGRLVTKKDLGNHYWYYEYDVAGRLTLARVANSPNTPVSSTSSGMEYTYYNSGLVKTVLSGDRSAPPEGGWSRVRSEITYDKLGRRVTERSWDDRNVYTRGARWKEGQYWYEDPGTWAAETREVLNTQAVYDALGRLTRFTELGTQLSPSATIDYAYDANGNIVSTVANHATLDGNGLESGRATDTYWFAYDSMNRLTIDRGVVRGGVVARAYQPDGSAVDSKEILYNQAGQRTAVLRTEYNYSWNQYTGASISFAENREIYIYNAAGGIDQIQISSSTPQAGQSNPQTGQIEPIGSLGAAPQTGTLRSKFYYDLLGRQTGQTDYEANGSTTAYSRSAFYNNKGQLTSDYTSTKRSDGTYTTSSTYGYGSGSDYALGSVTSVSTTSSGPGGSKSGLTTNYYGWLDGAVQSSIIVRADLSKNESHDTELKYNGVGRLTGVTVTDGDKHDVNYYYNVDDQIVRRSELYKTGMAPHEVWYRFNGQQLGYVGNNGTSDMGAADSIADRQQTPPTTPGRFRNGSNAYSSSTDFGSGQEAINSYSQGSAYGSYTVQAGDTLQGIATKLWGDSSLWYRLAEVNGLSGGSALAEGRILTIPGGVVRAGNSATTGTPYDPAAAIGDISPTTPTPQAPAKKNKCGVMGIILMIVIAVAVTAVTAGAGMVATGNATGIISGMSAFGSGLVGGAGAVAGAAAGAAAAAGTAAAVTTGISAATLIGVGAIAGAVGSLASQGVGIAIGVQKRIDWKGVALGAVSGAVQGGFAHLSALGTLATSTNSAQWIAQASKLSKVLASVGKVTNQPWIGGAIRGVAGSAINQGAGAIMGQKFDFAGLAAAGVSSGLTGGLGIHGAGSAIPNGLIGGFADVATRSIVTNTSFGDNVIAALPSIIGNTLGALITEGISSSGKMSKGEKALLALAQKSANEVPAESANFKHSAAEMKAAALLAKTAITREDSAAYIPEVQAELGLYADGGGRVWGSALDASISSYLDKRPAGDPRNIAWAEVQEEYRAERLVASRSLASQSEEDRTSSIATSTPRVNASQKVGDVDSRPIGPGGSHWEFFRDEGGKTDLALYLHENGYLKDPKALAIDIMIETPLYQLERFVIPAFERNQSDPAMGEVLGIISARAAEANARGDRAVGNLGRGLATGLWEVGKFTPIGGGADIGYRALTGQLEATDALSLVPLLGRLRSVASLNRAAKGEIAEVEAGVLARLPKCFAAGTQVHTRNGLKPIESLQIGDKVWSRSEHDIGEAAWRTVIEAGCTGEQEIYEVSVSTSEGRSEIYRTTALHPFWTEAGGFVAAGVLTSGDQLRLADGSAAYVKTVVATGEIEVVYNFSVEGWHTYHIGALGVWVHNDCFGALPKQIQSDLMSLGIDGSRFAANGSSVSMQIRMIGEMDPARAGALRRALDYFKGAGSGFDTVTIQTGPVINQKIVGKLTSAVRNGRDYLGMAVTSRGTSHLNGTDYPAFMLQWWRQ